MLFRYPANSLPLLAPREETMSDHASVLDESQNLLGASRLTNPNHNTYHNDHSYQVARSYHMYTPTTLQPWRSVTRCLPGSFSSSDASFASLCQVGTTHPLYFLRLCVKVVSCIFPLAPHFHNYNFVRQTASTLSRKAGEGEGIRLSG